MSTPSLFTLVPPKLVSVVNIFESFNVQLINNSHENLVPIVVLGFTDSIPNELPPGTIILRTND